MKKAPKVKKDKNGGYPKSLKQRILEAPRFDTPIYFIGTKADHLMGDISRDESDLFYAYKELDDVWIGCWVTGYGFIDVRFPKSTSRKLTKKEIKEYNNTYISLAGGIGIKLKVD